MKLTFALAFAFLMGAAAYAFQGDAVPTPAGNSVTPPGCVADGDCVTVSAPWPNLPTGGMIPPYWTSPKKASLKEDDVGPNDDMGSADVDSTGSSASAKVCNKGGDLSGPNGKDQNGGLEGDCIEVYIVFHGWSWSGFHDSYMPTEYYWTNDVEICPC